MVELRAPGHDELEAASDLCPKSKAFWGYDAAFLSACAGELTLTEDDLSHSEVTLAISNGELAGVAQVSNSDDGCFLEKLFVDPAFMGQGIGRKLFRWSCAAASQLGATRMIVESDPDAAAFYLAMGCTPAGQAKSGSISGRFLPRLICHLNDRRAH